MNNVGEVLEELNKTVDLFMKKHKPLKELVEALKDIVDDYSKHFDVGFEFENGLFTFIVSPKEKYVIKINM